MEALGKALGDGVTRYGRTVLDKDGLEVGISLMSKAFEEFTDFGRPVIDRDDDGIGGHLFVLWTKVGKSAALKKAIIVPC
jgi:hypothetical protein